MDVPSHSPVITAAVSTYQPFGQRILTGEFSPVDFRMFLSDRVFAFSSCDFFLNLMESNVIIAFFSWDFHHCLWIIRFSEKKGDFIGIFLTLSQGYVKIICVTDGEVSERFKELVLKTSDSKEPRVRIPSSPPFSILAAKKNIGLGYLWRCTQVGDEAPLLRA